MAPTVLTIGHSNHPLDYLIGLLRSNDVTAVVDVRSAPYSRGNPQFNRNSLAIALSEVGIKYLFLGRELGGRSRYATDYDSEGRVSYARMAASDDFKRGIARVLSGVERYRIALLCAERDPIDCHRTLLVGRELEKHGVTVGHILADGRIESNENATTRMLALHGMQEFGLFDSRERLVEKACELQARRVAYVDSQMAAEVVAR